MESVPHTGTRAIYRVLDLITELGQHLSGASASTLAGRLDLPAPTVHRLLQVLVATGFATKEPASKHYSLGPRIVSLAHRVGGAVTLSDIARPELERLAATTTETVFLAALDGNEIVFLDCIRSSQAVQLWSPPGTRRPLHATSQGKAVLAFLPEISLEGLLSACDFASYTRHTITQRRDLSDELDRVRRDGFAVADREFDEDARSVAAPILDAEGHAIGTVCVGVPQFRASLQQLRGELAPVVVDAAERISHQAQLQLRPNPSDKSAN